MRPSTSVAGSATAWRGPRHRPAHGKQVHDRGERRIERCDPRGWGLSTSGGHRDRDEQHDQRQQRHRHRQRDPGRRGGADVERGGDVHEQRGPRTTWPVGKSPTVGGILAGGAGERVELHSVTLAGNSADGTDSQGRNLASSNSVHALNSIVAKGKATTGGNCEGEAKSSKHDLEDMDTCGFNGDGDRVNRNPQLQRNLINNGGPTDTLALKRTSPAIDHAARRARPSATSAGSSGTASPTSARTSSAPSRSGRSARSAR